ncbi:MAG TPA: MATE family efflux transporter [Tissierellaceae bacterium]|nr:MATE family efflux transporter [Tissierellaceae bacterium]
MEYDLTQDNIYKSLLNFSIPFIIANLLQAIYGAVDLAVVSYYTGASGLSAVSIGTQIMQIVNGLIIGLSMGGTILVGQYYGARKREDVIETIGTIFTSGIILSLIITVIMFLLIKPLLGILQTPSEAYNDARDYVLFASVGVVFIFGYNAVSAILRGLGDSKSPLYFIGIACIFNVLLDFLFVGRFNMRAYGAALATVLSQGTSMVLALIYIGRKEFIFQFKLKNLSLHKEKVKKLLYLGFPLSLQEVLLWGSFLVIVAIANQMGVAQSAAVGVVAKVETFAMLPPMALSNALAAISAQNIGAGKPERAKKSLNISIFISFIISIFFFIWGQRFPESIMRIFKADQSVINVGVKYLKSFSYDFMLVAFKFNLNGFLNGCGCTKFAMINGIASSVLVRIPLAYLLAIYISKGMVGLGMAAPLASIISIIGSLIYIRKERWRVGLDID